MYEDLDHEVEPFLRTNKDQLTQLANSASTSLRSLSFADINGIKYLNRYPGPLKQLFSMIMFMINCAPHRPF